MFKYLVITKDRSQFLIEEEGGSTLYRFRAFLTLLKNNFPRVIFRKFKGRPAGGHFTDVDLIFIVPSPSGSALLDQLLEGQSRTFFEHLEPTATWTIPRQELRIELLGRGKKGTGTVWNFSDSFETATRKLVALLRFDAIDPAWRQGTQARISAKQRFAFFIDNRNGDSYRGKRGTVHEH
jgi:hypothetical protein